MITKCILIYALLVNNFGFSVADEVIDLTDCDNYVPETCYQYATLLVEHFDEKNIETAVKVMWCESRNKADAYRWQDQDSGLFQTIPRTWGWVKKEHDIPYWDYPVGNTYAQFIPRYNIEVAALVVFIKNSELAKNNDHLKIEMADGYVDVYRKKKKT